ncbi:hypothetical protein [Pseudomonas fluorescens]|uniref:Uncharacterized protein n=1 Tax=Pseudomonas fluorescens TaxID=294 RepID=A0A5E7V7R7_PSEFL|nr:hypothetical protein [Pseudomonas fluorescens]VVQ15694.1 hypothetical protein PS928_04294 [Pseudomonas fluorescens]
MDIRPDIQIPSMIKAMIDVVLPAVDPEHKMAQEQARLVIGTLQLIAKRLPLAYRYDVDELNRYVTFAREIAMEMRGSIDTPSCAELERLADRGSEVLDGARTDPPEIESAIFQLRAAVGQLIQDVNAKAPTDVRKTLRQRVLNMSKTELERELALVIDMGFEMDPDKRPVPIEKQLPPIRRK